MEWLKHWLRSWVISRQPPPQNIEELIAQRVTLELMRVLPQDKARITSAALDNYRRELNDILDRLALIEQLLKDVEILDYPVTVETQKELQKQLALLRRRILLDEQDNTNH